MKERQFKKLQEQKKKAKPQDLLEIEGTEENENN